jgi:putative phosphoesterase
VKIALISDVHANIIALEAVLEDMKDRGIERILSAGDVVGYYPYPNETIAAFRRHDITSIQGNHDRAVLSVDTSGMNPAAVSAVDWTARHLSDDSFSYLRSLPPRTLLRIDGLSIAVYHGAPFDDDYYLYEGEAQEGLLAMAGCELLVLGHTHEPFIKRFRSGTIMNPGSVGQPRDGDPESSYSILDTDTGKVMNRRVGYDIDTVAARTRDEGLPAWLAERLYYGH